jgi:hypothetical protein
MNRLTRGRRSALRRGSNLIGFDLNARAERGLEEARMSGSDTVPTKGIQVSSKLTCRCICSLLAWVGEAGNIFAPVYLGVFFPFLFLLLDRGPIMEVLTAYVRENAPRYAAQSKDRKPTPLRNGSQFPHHQEILDPHNLLG